MVAVKAVKDVKASFLKVLVVLWGVPWRPSVKGAREPPTDVFGEGRGEVHMSGMAVVV